MVYLLVVLLVIIAFIWLFSRFFHLILSVVKAVFYKLPKKLYEIWSKPQ